VGWSAPLARRRSSRPLPGRTPQLRRVAGFLAGAESHTPDADHPTPGTLRPDVGCVESPQSVAAKIDPASA